MEENDDVDPLLYTTDRSRLRTVVVDPDSGEIALEADLETGIGAGVEPRRVVNVGVDLAGNYRRFLGPQPVAGGVQ